MNGHSHHSKKSDHLHAVDNLKRDLAILDCKTRFGSSVSPTQLRSVSVFPVVFHTHKYPHP